MATILVGILACGLVVAADQDEAKTKPRPIGGLAFVGEIELTVVNIIAYVTDKDGNPITDLEQKDFRILQDGEERPVTNFERFTRQHLGIEPAPLPSPTASAEDLTPAEAAPAAEERPVYIALYIDNENSRPLDRNRVLRDATAFVTDNLVPPVQMMVVSYQRSIKILQPFTTDPTEVTAALRSLRTHTADRPNRDSTRKDILEVIQRYAQDHSMTSESHPSQVQGQIQAFAEEEANSLAFSLDGLRTVITSLAGLPGKKAVVYISNGLPMSPGLDLMYAYSNAYDDPSALTMAARYDQTRRFESLVASANAKGVSFYTMGAGGLENTGMSSAEYSGPQDTIAASVGADNYVSSLRFMAESTGGFAIVNTNDFVKGFERISHDIFTYYSLGYPLNLSGGDRVHRIEVLLPEHPDYRVRYRSRFVERSLETRVQDTVVTGLLFDIDDNPLQVELTAGAAAPATGDRWTLPVHLSFPLRKVALLPQSEDYVGSVVLFIAARDTDGKQSDLVRQEHEVRVPAKDYEAIERDRYGIDAVLLMEEGSYTLAIGLLDQITRQVSYQVLRTAVPGER